MRHKITKLKNTIYKFQLVKDSIATIFLFLSYLILIPLGWNGNDIINIALVAYGSFIVIIIFGLFFQFIIRSNLIYKIPKTVNHHSYLALYIIFGLSIPLSIFSVILRNIQGQLQNITYYESFICDLRQIVISLINMIQKNDILPSLIIYTLIIAITVQIYGAYKTK